MFATIPGYKNHVLNVHRPRRRVQYKCSICSELFDNSMKFKHHAIAHRHMKCDQCQELFFKSESMALHKTSCHERVSEESNQSKENSSSMPKEENKSIKESPKKVDENVKATKKDEPSIEEKRNTAECSKSTEVNIEPNQSENVLQDKQSLNCRICDKILDCSDSLEKHSTEHTFYHHLTLKCSYCYAMFTSMDSYKFHMIKHGVKRKLFYKCFVCTKSFPATKFKIHALEHIHIKCPYCPEIFFKIDLLSKHSASCPQRPEELKKPKASCPQRPEEVKKIKASSQYTLGCTFCTERFARHADLKNHDLERHCFHNNLTIECNDCSFIFESMDAYSMHASQDHGIKAVKFKCFVCSKILNNALSFKTHATYHHHMKCEQCPELFFKRTELALHKSRCHEKSPEENKDSTNEMKNNITENFEEKGIVVNCTVDKTTKDRQNNNQECNIETPEIKDTQGHIKIKENTKVFQEISSEDKAKIANEIQEKEIQNKDTQLTEKENIADVVSRDLEKQVSKKQVDIKQNKIQEENEDKTSVVNKNKSKPIEQVQESIEPLDRLSTSYKIQEKIKTIEEKQDKASVATKVDKEVKTKHDALDKTDATNQHVMVQDMTENASVRPEKQKETVDNKTVTGEDRIEKIQGKKIQTRETEINDKEKDKTSLDPTTPEIGIETQQKIIIEEKQNEETGESEKVNGDSIKTTPKSQKEKEQDKNTIKIKEVPSFDCTLCPETFSMSSILEDHYTREHTFYRHLKLKCTKCHKILETVRSYETHMLDHGEKVNSFECLVCSKIFHSSMDFNKHTVEHRHVKCDKCPSLFFRNDLLSMHRGNCQGNLEKKKEVPNTEHKEETLVCDLCTETFTDALSLENHKTKHTFYHNLILCCNLCSAIFRTIHNYKSHIIKCHGLGRPRYKCHVCAKLFDDEIAFKHHALGHHQMKCDVCSELFIKNESMILHKTLCHKRTEDKTKLAGENTKVAINKTNVAGDKTKEKTKRHDIQCDIPGKRMKAETDKSLEEPDPTFKCQLCGQSFSSSNSLEDHTIKEHTFYGNITLKCNYCKRIFRSIQSYKSHMYDHGVRTVNYRCFVCLRMFDSPKLFQIHTRKHRQLKCDQCIFLYFKSSTLAKHKSTIHQKNKVEETPSKDIAKDNSQSTCDLCDKVFKYRWELEKHSKEHTFYHNLSLYCKYCRKVYTKIDAYVTHMQQHYIRGGLRFKCYVCANFFDDKRSFENHTLEHRQVICSKCPGLFFKNEELVQHKFLYHAKKIETVVNSTNTEKQDKASQETKLSENKVKKNPESSNELEEKEKQKALKNLDHRSTIEKKEKEPASQSKENKKDTDPKLETEVDGNQHNEKEKAEIIQSLSAEEIATNKEYTTLIKEVKTKETDEAKTGVDTNEKLKAKSSEAIIESKKEEKQQMFKSCAKAAKEKSEKLIKKDKTDKETSVNRSSKEIKCTESLELKQIPAKNKEKEQTVDSCAKSKTVEQTKENKEKKASKETSNTENTKIVNLFKEIKVQEEKISTAKLNEEIEGAKNSATMCRSKDINENTDISVKRIKIEKDLETNKEKDESAISESLDEARAKKADNFVEKIKIKVEKDATEDATETENKTCAKPKDSDQTLIQPIENIKIKKEKDENPTPSKEINTKIENKLIEKAQQYEINASTANSTCATKKTPEPSPCSSTTFEKTSPVKQELTHEKLLLLKKQRKLMKERRRKLMEEELEKGKNLPDENTCEECSVVFNRQDFAFHMAQHRFINEYSAREKRKLDEEESDIDNKPKKKSKMEIANQKPKTKILPTRSRAADFFKTDLNIDVNSNRASKSTKNEDMRCLACDESFPTRSLLDNHSCSGPF